MFFSPTSSLVDPTVSLSSTGAQSETSACVCVSPPRRLLLSLRLAPLSPVIENLPLAVSLWMKSVDRSLH